MTFQEAAIASARLYNTYLERKGGASSYIDVSEIEQDKNAHQRHTYFLKMAKKILHIDSVLIEVRGQTYNNSEITPIEYSNLTQMLKVRLGSKVANVFEHCSPEDVKIVSDMSFLITRTENWYREFGTYLTQPKGASFVAPADYKALSQTPSEDQSSAINGVLSKPFTYVWGAPGTGKTQLVLARVALAYIQQKKRILITAPTNNAVEQTLYGLLSVFEEAGIDYEKLVFRLGIPNDEFASKYPKLCENYGSSSAISNILDKLSSLRIALDKNRKARECYNDYIAFTERQSELSKTIDQLRATLRRLAEISTLYQNEQFEINQLLSRIAQMETERTGHKDSQDFYNRQARQLLRKANNPLRHVLALFSQKKLQTSIDSALQNARHYEDKSQKVQLVIDDFQKRVDLHSAKAEECQRFFDELVSQARKYSANHEEMDSIVRNMQLQTADPSIQRLDCICESLLHSYNLESQHYEPVLDHTETFYEDEEREITEQIDILEKRKAELMPSDFQKRMEECLVIACTIDQCLHRFPVSSENYYEHVFLDEAGYAPLIKAAALTAYGDRITFLGDHMQLPPVCEASITEIKKREYRLLAFWAQSALYTESVFFQSPQKICEDFLNTAKIPCRDMKQYSLVNSYRFGEALAQVLADDVYDSRFHGNDGHNTKIFFIDAPHRTEEERHVSHSECEALERLLRNCGDYRKNSGIITPYRVQRKLLKQMAKRVHFPEENILTIHASQGREWDNIFLCVADPKEEYFTDSLKPTGKKVINTAVSRAKKALIIVCDYHYWITQKSQLIGKLLTIADKLEIEK